jgi:acyl-CoA synthetase (AMP-forming)/AMP-acid ligase II
MRVKRPELVLAAAVALSLPMVPGILDGGIGAMTALTRFLMALLACWAAGAVLSTVLTRYNEDSRRAEIVRAIEAAQQAAAANAAAEADGAHRSDQAGNAPGPG